MLDLFVKFGIYPSTTIPTGNFADATGGQWVYEIVDNGTTYRVHEFTVGTSDFEVLTEGDFEYLIIGGGGGGGAGSNGEGGSGGQVVSGTTSLSTGIYSITVGAQGDQAPAGNDGTAGSNSTAFGFTANGGAGGASGAGSGETGLNGTSSDITGETIFYGPDGGSAGGPSGDEYGEGGSTGGGDAGDPLRMVGTYFNPRSAWKGLNGLGAGGGGSNFISNNDYRSGSGGYGRVVIRYEIESLSTVEYPIHPKPQAPATKWYAMWDSQNQFVGNAIKAQSISTARTMHESTGQPYSGLPVIADDLTNSFKTDTLSGWQNTLDNYVGDLHLIGEDNVYLILLADEPNLSLTDMEERIEMARSTLNTNGQDFKMGITITYRRAGSFGTEGFNYEPLPGNLDYVCINYYPYTEAAPILSNQVDGNGDQDEFEENFDMVVERVSQLIAPNTRIGITGQGFYGDFNQNGVEWTHPPDDMPNWLAAKVIAHPLVDGIIWWDWDAGNGTDTFSLHNSELASLWTEVQNAYTTYFT